MTRQSLLLLSLALILFFIIIQLQNPRQAISKEEDAKADTISKAISYQSSGRAVIGQIQTRDKVIIIRSGADGQLYTVKSKDGNLLAVDLNIEELDAKFPELKEVVENGLAGNDATLRIKNTYDNKALLLDVINK